LDAIQLCFIPTVDSDPENIHQPIISTSGAGASSFQYLHNMKMRVLRPRSRIVSIRMSEEEFSTLRRICLATGARSVSDLAREAMRGLLNGTNQPNGGDRGMNEYSAQMRDLEQKVEKLSAEVALVKADRNL
jgi:hypothetical protein